MNTAPTLPKHTSELNTDATRFFGVLVDMPQNFGSATCMIAPLRRLFSKAVAGKSTRAIPLAGGVLLIIESADGATALELIRAELEALGYTGIAHVGRREPDGWICLHGSADKVANFEELLEYWAAQLSFETQITAAHGAAALREF
jgi:hypothetical protein